MQRLLKQSSWTLVFSCLLAATGLAQTQGTEVEGSPQAINSSPLDGDGKLVQFGRDIAPIMKRHCLECHGPEDAKNDFRVDDREIFLEYIEPDDADSSSLYVDYLTIDDVDWLMPPTTHGGPLAASDLALIRVWINEGADWPEDYKFKVDSDQPDQVEATPAATGPRPLQERVWQAQGFLHPATVHFPIALFMLGGGFVVLGWMWPAVGTQIPLTCLLLGALTSIASSAMGWAFAPQQGYGFSWDLFDWDREVDVHRWSALIVTLVSLVLAVLALMSLWKGSQRLTKIWKIGLLVCAGMVGAVGHQGGELSYGKDFYPRAWRILTDTAETPPTEALDE